MARPVKSWPKKNVVTFRLSDPEYAELKFFAQHVANVGETFSDTLARVLRDLIVKAAADHYAEIKRIAQPPKLSFTHDNPEARRARYAAEARQARAEILKAGKVVKKAVEDGNADLESDVPTLIDVAIGEVVPGGLASPSVVAVARPEAAAHDTTGAGQSDQKNTDFSTDRNFPARENCLQENS